MILLSLVAVGDSDSEQLGKIFNILGTPSELNWPECSHLPGFVDYEPREPLDLRPLFQGDAGAKGTNPALDLLLKLLSLNPLKRLSAKQFSNEAICM